MDHQAHGLDLSHPVFTTPRRAEFTWNEVPREDQYEGGTSVRYPRGMDATYRLAAFEKEKPSGWNPILVNHEGFFTDIPGFENLAEGHSEKCLGSLSLARQGKWFYWGFSIDPERMTDPAQDTLVNVLHYMKGMRGSRTVRFVCVTRQILSVYHELSRRSGYLRGIEEHLPGQLVPAWRSTYTPTLEGCKAWLDRHLAYVFSGKGLEHTSERYKTVFEVDADALALGTPNRERASMERWMDLASAGEESEARGQARRCLARYVHPDIAPKDGDWAAWYRTWKDRIVFIESTGFWWQEDPRLPERAAPARAVTPR